VALLLNEGAIEIRNMAKMGFMRLKESFGGIMNRDLEHFLRRTIQNDKTYEKVK